MTISTSENAVRIPNLPLGQMVDENGNATPSELTFRQTLLTNLQKNFGDEGCVIPIQTTANITTIQNNQAINNETGVLGYTCGYGRFIYNSDTNTIMVSVDNGLGVPVFKTVTLT